MEKELAIPDQRLPDRSSVRSGCRNADQDLPPYAARLERITDAGGHP
jgi:hypothetical protein